MSSAQTPRYFSPVFPFLRPLLPPPLPLPLFAWLSCSQADSSPLPARTEKEQRKRRHEVDSLSFPLNNLNLRSSSVSLPSSRLSGKASFFTCKFFRLTFSPLRSDLPVFLVRCRGRPLHTLSKPHPRSPSPPLPPPCSSLSRPSSSSVSLPPRSQLTSNLLSMLLQTKLLPETTSLQQERAMLRKLSLVRPSRPTLLVRLALLFRISRSLD